MFEKERRMKKMTKEELKQESEEYFKSICGDYNEEYERTGKRHYWVGVDIKNAYLASAEPREKRIAELEVTNKKISDECHKLVDSLEKKQNENELLETQNIKLQAEVSRLTIKNAELKADNDARKFAMAMSEKVEKQLREENAKLKDVIEGYKKIAKWCDNCDKIAELKSENQKWKAEWVEQVQKATDEGYARTLQTIQLTKAKDLLLRFVELKNKPCASGHSINMLLYENICADTEQFLKGDGCPDCFCEDCTKDCGIKKFGLVEVEK